MPQVSSSGVARPLRRRAAWTWIALALLVAGAARADLAADARRLVGADQGVYVETEDGTVLVAQEAARAVHPASVSKVPTTLALLRKLGADHRFPTRFVPAGPLANGAIAGDLVVQGSGDPYFVDENAALVAIALREVGVRKVGGALVGRGPLLFNWQTQGAAARLQRAFSAGVSPGAWQAVRADAGATGAKSPTFAFGPKPAGGQAAGEALVVHYSEPLVPLVKALNGFSNNIFANFAEAAGGIAEVQAIARESVPAAWSDEIILGDGAGANRRNRLSPRAAVALLRALEAELARSKQSLPDVLPVAGIDDGTLRHRLDGPDEIGRVVGKTGTYGDYGACALAGAVRTRDRGIVYFAVLNRGVPIEPARKRQDAFVRAMLAQLDTVPWRYERDASPAFTRAQVVTRGER